MKIAVVGVGYWGPNLVRNFLKNDHVNGVICIDNDRNRLDFILRQYPNVETETSYERVLDEGDVDAVVISTPVNTHYNMARSALEKGKHVLIEKPMTANSRDARALHELAEDKDLILMVDHIFVYNGAVRKIKELIKADEIGNIMYYDAVRINLGLFQHDVNVIWDLAIHDLSIMDFLLPEKPVAVSAVGIGHYDNRIENISYLTLFFKSNCIGHIHVNWLAPVKIRRILIGGDKKMIVFDDVEPVEKIRVYDKGVSATTQEGIYETLIQYRTGDMYAPKFDTTESLESVADEFTSSIRNHTQPMTNGAEGIRMIKLLEAAEKSIKSQGCIIDLNGI
jgi:predicted dehydrogenase